MLCPEIVSQLCPVSPVLVDKSGTSEVGLGEFSLCGLSTSQCASRYFRTSASRPHIWSAVFEHLAHVSLDGNHGPTTTPRAPGSWTSAGFEGLGDLTGERLTSPRRHGHALPGHIPFDQPPHAGTHSDRARFQGFSLHFLPSSTPERLDLQPLKT